MIDSIVKYLSEAIGLSNDLSYTAFILVIGITFGLILIPLTKFIMKSWLHIKKTNPKILGEISSDIGIGLFVNSTFQITTGGDSTNYTSVIFMTISAIVLIIIGSIWKWR